MHHAERCCSACNFDPQYQATSMAYRADRRATHAPNNTGVPAAGGREAPGPNVTSRERTQAGCRQGAGTGSLDVSRACVPRGRAVPSLVAYSTLSCQEKATRTVLE